MWAITYPARMHSHKVVISDIDVMSLKYLKKGKISFYELKLLGSSYSFEYNLLSFSFDLVPKSKIYLTGAK